MINANVKWLEQCSSLAHTFSKDRSSQIGAIVVNYWERIRVTGYNGFVTGADDEEEIMHMRPAKYMWTVHAEANAIANAAADGVAIRGCKLYTSMSVCSRCAPLIVQAGIGEVISYAPNDAKNFMFTNPDTREMWSNETLLAERFFMVGKVKVTYVKST